MPIYRNIYDGPPKGYTATFSKKRYVVIHNTANDAPAGNEASYAKRRTDSVSSHYYVDDERIIQSLNTDYRAWHAGSGTGNNYGISYEIVGTNSKPRSWWLANVRWDLLAKQIATDMKHFGIKNQHLSISQMRDGKTTGIVTHDDMRRAWGGTTHTDPGSNFPMDHLIKEVQKHLTGEDDDMELTDMVSVINDTHVKHTDSNGNLVSELTLERHMAQTNYYAIRSTHRADAAVAKAVQLESKLTELAAKVDAISIDGEVTVNISDEQLERVLRKVIGSVDGINLPE